MTASASGTSRMPASLAIGVLALLRARALGKRFHLPFGDGTVIAVAGVWAAALIVVRVLDRPLGQNLLALACAAMLVAAGARERAKRPADDIPPEHAGPTGPRPRRPREDTTVILEEETEPLAPPEFEPYRSEPGEQLHLGGEPPRRQPPGEA